MQVKAIIPVAGQGLRLKPITDEIPKPLIEVAGKPVLAHILDNIARSSVEEIVLIVSHEKDKLVEWTRENYEDRFEIHFMNQTEPLGLGHAILCAGKHLEGEILISLGDEIFAREYSSMLDEIASSRELDASIGTKYVEDSSHYGMVSIAEDGLVSKLVEKPPAFDGNEAIAGVYYIKHGAKLRAALEAITDRPLEGREYQLTDALQYMIEDGSVFGTFKVGEYFDCGRLSTILDSNRRLVEKYADSKFNASLKQVEVTEPRVISTDALITNSTIGPYVSIGSNVVISDCHLKNTIVSQSTKLVNIKAENSIVANSGVLSLDDGNH